MSEGTPQTDAAGGAANNPLSRKLNKVLESRLDADKDMLEALKSLSTFFSENNLRNRRNLRGDIERRSLIINEDFVDSFGKVISQLNSVHNDVKAMDDCCESMVSRLRAAKEQTRDLINQTTKLQTESKRLELRADVADAFLTKYQLTPAETMVLRRTQDQALHPDFFQALKRVQEIHTDCKVLLRTNQQTAGLEIMEAMALHQESAYERLYRWTQNECRLLTSDNIDVSSQLCQAMEALHNRPVLFRYSLDEFGTARRTAIVRGFIDALTRGGPGGTPRPIELHSHDPLRYIGDMLAWLHQAMASEREHLIALLKHCKQDGLSAQIKAVLSHITEGVCRPLKVRVEQVLVSEPGSVVLYKLANLLKFYLATMKDILEDDKAALVTLVDDMNTLSLKLFYNSVNIHTNKLMEKVELPGQDLGPTRSLHQTLQLLQDILTSHDSSVVPVDLGKEDFAKILSCIVDPLIQMCLLSASNLNSIDMATYMINCLHLIQTTLSLYAFTDQRIEMLQAQTDAHIDTLVSEQASFVLNHIGLGQAYGMVQQHNPDIGNLTDVPGVEPASLKTALQKFDIYLASPDNLMLPQSTYLVSGKLRDAVKSRSSELIFHAYETIHKAIMDPANQYPNPQSIMRLSPQQIKELLP